jgi:hypothetical protein
VVAVVVSALSMPRTGFVFGIEKQFFHLPIVGGLQCFGAKTDFRE